MFRGMIQKGFVNWGLVLQPRDIRCLYRLKAIVRQESYLYPYWVHATEKNVVAYCNLNGGLWDVQKWGQQTIAWNYSVIFRYLITWNRFLIRSSSRECYLYAQMGICYGQGQKVEWKIKQTKWHVESYNLLLHLWTLRGIIGICIPRC